MKAEFYGVAPLLQVYDMPSAVRFYRDVLGFELLNRSGEGEEFDWCLLARNGAEVMLNTMYEREQRPPEPELKRAAAHGDTGLFFACCELDAVYEHLRGHSVEADPPRTASYGMRQLYFKDPDGYGICFQWPADEAGLSNGVTGMALQHRLVGIWTKRDLRSLSATASCQTKVKLFCKKQ